MYGMRARQVLLAAAVLVFVWGSGSWAFYSATVHKSGRGAVARRHQALHDARKEAARGRADDATDAAAAATTPTFVTAVLHEADVDGAVALGRSIQRVYAGRARQVCVRADTLLAYAAHGRRDADADESLRSSGWSRVRRFTSAALFGEKRVVAGAEVAASAALLRAAALGLTEGGDGEEAEAEAAWVYLSPDSVVLRALTPRQLAAAALDPRVLLSDERRLTQPLSRRILRAFLSGEKSARQTAEKAEEAAETKVEAEVWDSGKSGKKKKKKKEKSKANEKRKAGSRRGKGKGKKSLSNAAEGEDTFARLFDDEAPAVFAVGREPSALRGGGGGGGTWELVSGLSTVGGSGTDAAAEPRRIAASAQERYGGADAVPCIDGGFLMFRPSAALRERATAAVWRLLGDGAAAAAGAARPPPPPLVFCEELSGCAAQHLLSTLLEPLVCAAAFSDGAASVLLLPRAVAAPRAPVARLRLPAAHGGGGGGGDEGIETAPPQRVARSKVASQESAAASLSLALRFDEVKPWDDVEGFVRGGLRKARPLFDGAAAAAAETEEERGVHAGGHAARALEAVDRGVVYGRPYELWWRLRGGGGNRGGGSSVDAAAAGAELVLRGGAFGESCDAVCRGARLRCSSAAAFAALGGERAGCDAQVAVWGAGGCPGGCEAAVHATLGALPELGGWPRGGGGEKRRRKTGRGGSLFPAYAGDVGVCYANTLSDPRMAPACGASHPRLRRVCVCVAAGEGGQGTRVGRGEGRRTRARDFGVDDFPVPSRAALDEMFGGM